MGGPSGGGVFGGIGLPSTRGADAWLADALSGDLPRQPDIELRILEEDGTFDGPMSGEGIPLDIVGVRLQSGGIGGGSSGPPPVPEPATLTLLLMGGALLAGRRRH